MSVNEHVDTVHNIQQVRGTVAKGFLVDAQMAQADDVIAAVRLQGVHLRLCAVKHGLVAQNGHALDLSGVCLGCGLRGLQTEHADLDTGRRGEDLVGVECHLPLIEHVGCHNGELGFLGEIHQIVIAVVELVVAKGRDVIPGHVHQFNSRFTLRNADRGIALAEVAGVHQQDIGTLSLIGFLQGRHLGIAGNSAVHIVGVQHYYIAVHLALGLVRRDCDRQGEDHSQCQQHRQELLHSQRPPFYLGRYNLQASPALLCPNYTISTFGCNYYL